jgi:hypothetical protein
MLGGPLAFQQVGDHLIAAIQTRLAGTSAGTAGRAGVAHGTAETVAWDDCDCAGLLTVAVGRQYGSNSFPDEAGQGFPGAGASGIGGAPGSDIEWPLLLVAEMAIQVVRCAAVPEPPATSVPAAVLAAEAQTGLIDAHETLVAVTCALYELKQARDIDNYQVRDRAALGPTGGCQGWQLNAAVSVEFLCPCP